MLTRVGNYIKEKDLVREGDRVLAMVSGGADSVAMLHILSELSGGAHPAFPETFSLGICHVNYGRRGQASDDDEILVRGLGDRKGLPVHVIQAPREQHSNFQAWARDFRYLAAQNLSRWQGYTRIAVAHNKDDRIETFIYRLMTYSGRRSLVVMPPLKGRIIRPLLFATAAEVRNFCVEAGVGYHDDESNLSLDYTRNQIRQLLIPRMAEIRPDFRERITDTLSLLEDEDALLKSATNEAWLSAAETGDDNEEVLIRAEAVAEMPRATARLVIRRWLSMSGVRVRLSRRLLDSIVALCRHQQGTSSISLAGGLQVQRRYDRLMLVSEENGGGHPQREEPGGVAQKDKSAAGREIVLTVPGKIVFGDYEIEAIESPAWDLRESGPMQAVIDAGRLEEPSLLKVRPWQPGDRFAPLGLGGSKSIQDLFTDSKVPRTERERIPIVISGDKIVWVCGFRIAEDFKVSDFSQRLVGLRATRRAVERAV